MTFWIKVLTAQPTTQTIYGSGRRDDNTGTLFRLSNYASVIYMESVTSGMYLTSQYFVGETLMSWTHIALVEYADSGSVII